MARRENLGPKDQLDLQDQEEDLEQEAILAQSVLLGFPDLPVPMVNLESKESPESKARKEMLGLQDRRA